MTWLLTLLALAGATLLLVFHRMVAEQGQTMLLALPRQLLGLARRRAGEAHRDEMYTEWIDVLDAANEDRKGKPISQVLFGLRYALGVLYAAPIVSRERDWADVAAAERAHNERLRGLMAFAEPAFAEIEAATRRHASAYPDRIVEILAPVGLFVQRWPAAPGSPEEQVRTWMQGRLTEIHSLLPDPPPLDDTGDAPPAA